MSKQKTAVRSAAAGSPSDFFRQRPRFFAFYTFFPAVGTVKVSDGFIDRLTNCETGKFQALKVQGGSAPFFRSVSAGLPGRFFAAMLGERVAAAEWLSDVDTVVPVPLHWTRRLRRGYNQAEVIASEIAKALGARLRTDILKRRRRTSTQTKLGIKEKARNVSGAFAVSRKFRRRFHNPEILNSASLNGISGERNSMNIRHILLVDDVFTTGSTLYNCWRPLHDFFGPQVRISIATLGVV